MESQLSNPPASLDHPGERLDVEQMELLELVARGADKEQAFRALTDAIGRLSADTRAAILVATPDRRAMSECHSSQLGTSFTGAVPGLPIGELAIGTCGTAIFEARPIACLDVAQDGRWAAPWRQACLASDIRGCRSEPIFARDGQAIGSVFLCFAEPREATAWELRLASFAAHIASIVLEQDRAARTARRREAQELEQRRVLQLIAEDAPLGEVFGALLDMVERQSETEVRASLMLLDEDGKRLRSVAARGLPEAYCRLIDGLPVGEGVGACGTAAHRGTPVYVADVATDPLCASFREVGREFGLGACGSTPVFARDGRLLGTLGVYYPSARSYDDSDRRTIELATHLAAIALERHAANAALHQSEAEARLLQSLSAELVVQKDVTGIYGKLLDAAVTVMGSRCASLQIVHTEGAHAGQLELLSHREFSPGAAMLWKWIDADGDTVCAEALRTRQRVVFEDVMRAPMSAKARAAFAREGIQAVQSTPLISRRGTIVGMISTHWERPHRPTERELRNLDIVARQAAELIERWQIENALRRSEARARAFVAASSDVVYRISPDWSELWQLEASELAGAAPQRSQTYVEDFIPEEDRARVRAAIDHAVRTRSAFDLEHRILRPDGTVGWTHSRAVPLFDDDGEITEWFGAAKDISEGKRMVELLQSQAEQLREADRRKDEFLATLAHELRNPLAPIRNGVELLRRADNDGARAERVSTIMHRSVEHMVRLIDDLLDVSRITRGRITLQRRPVSIQGVLDQAVETVRPQLAAAGHQLACRLPEEPLVVEGDEARLAQVFSNLLGNAAKYTPGGGRIGVSARRDGHDLVVSVEDNGIGIPPEMRERIFDLFVQVDRSLERTQGGLGIGLTLVHRLVALHGGSIAVHSAGAPGLGSRFDVRLPAAAGVAPSGPCPVAREEAGGCRVLVVDDNRDSAETLELMVQAMGHTTRVGYDGLEAIELAGELRPDVVLLDIGMPRLNGYEACRRIRQQSWGRDLVIVAMTGWGQEEDRRRSSAAGFDEHLVKPVDAESIAALLRRVTRA